MEEFIENIQKEFITSPNDYVAIIIDSDFLKLDILQEMIINSNYIYIDCLKCTRENILNRILENKIILLNNYNVLYKDDSLIKEIYGVAKKKKAKIIINSAYSYYSNYLIDSKLTYNKARIYRFYYNYEYEILPDYTESITKDINKIVKYSNVNSKLLNDIIDLVKYSNNIWYIYIKLKDKYLRADIMSCLVYLIKSSILTIINTEIPIEMLTELEDFLEDYSDNVKIYFTSIAYYDEYNIYIDIIGKLLTMQNMRYFWGNFNDKINLINEHFKNLLISDKEELLLSTESKNWKRRILISEEDKDFNGLYYKFTEENVISALNNTNALFSSRLRSKKWYKSKTFGVIDNKESGANK